MIDTLMKEKLLF